MPEESQFDGHTKVIGVDTSSDPSENPSRLLSGAINRSFRGGVNRTRPPYNGLEHIFADDETEDVFNRGAVSAAYGYTKWRDRGNSQIVMACSDRLLSCIVAGNRVTIKTVVEGISKGLLNGWFIQVADNLYFQNGLQFPLWWNGVDKYEYLSGTGTIPIGTCMGFSQGRLIVHTSNNYSIIGDHIYGNALTDTRGAEKFTEYQLYGDLGAIGTDVDLGAIVGSIAIPKAQTPNFQGDHLVLTENGAFTLTLSGLRSEWINSGIQNTVLKGRGACSSHSIVAANGDIWFATSDGGITSFKFDRSERDRYWGETSMSREVGEYLSYTHPTHRQFISSAVFDNRLLTTCAFTFKHSELGGFHRYAEGLVSLDFDRGSTSQPKSGYAWDGLWTGLNISHLVPLSVNGDRRCFAISHDEDGRNRIYEIGKSGYHDTTVEGKSRKIVSFYHTPYLFEQVEPNELYAVRELQGARLVLSDIPDNVNLSVLYRPDYYKKWFPLLEDAQVGYLPKKEAPFDITQSTDNFQVEIQTPAPVGNDCIESTKQQSHQGLHFQVGVRIEGAANVNILSVEAGVLASELSAPTCDDGQDGAIRFADEVNLDEQAPFGYKVVLP